MKSLKSVKYIIKSINFVCSFTEKEKVEIFNVSKTASAVLYSTREILKIKIYQKYNYLKNSNDRKKFNFSVTFYKFLNLNMMFLFPLRNSFSVEH